MKKLFLVIIFFFIIAAIGLFVFVLTFDANRYKPLLIEKIEEVIKKDIRIANISLSAFPPVTINLQGVSIKDAEKTWSNVMLEVGSAEAKVKLLPLIRKDIQIERLFVRGLDLVIKEDIRIGVTEAVLKDVSLYGPIHADAALSVFGRGAENIKVTADLYPDVGNKGISAKNLDVRVDLDRFDLKSALDALGRSVLSQQIIGKEVTGQLAITSEKLRLDPKGIFDSDIYVDLSKGMTDILPVKGSLKDIELKAEMSKGDLILQRFTGALAKGRFFVKGSVNNIIGSRDLDLDIELKDIDVSMLLPDVAPGRPHFEGIVSMSMASSASGSAKEDIVNTLRATGTVGLDEAVLRNMNILVVALDKLDMLPGLVQKLKNRLPERYKELLRQNYTAFEPMDAGFAIKDGKLVFQKVVIESDAFYLVGSGYLSLDGAISVSSDLFIPPDLSAAFIDAADEFAYLQNSQGMITIPVDIYGRFPDVSVKPDLDYVIQKLAVSKGQELLERIFRKEGPEEKGAEPGTEQQGEGGAETQKQQEEIEPAEALIRTIFDIIASPRE